MDGTTATSAPGDATRLYLAAMRNRGPLSIDREGVPTRHKRYPDAERAVLPWGAQGGTALDLVGELLRELLGVARLMWFHQLDDLGGPLGGPPVLLLGRPAPSGGGLYPIEAYVAAGEPRVPGLPAALYHYDPVHHALERVRQGDHIPALTGLLADPAAPDVTIVLSAVFWRSMFKYGDFGYRLICQETGVLLAQAMAVAGRLGLTARARLRFPDGDVDRLLGLDGAREAALAVLTLTLPHPATPDNRHTITPDNRHATTPDNRHATTSDGWNATVPDGFARNTAPSLSSHLTGEPNTPLGPTSAPDGSPPASPGDAFPLPSSPGDGLSLPSPDESSTPSPSDGSPLSSPEDDSPLSPPGDGSPHPPRLDGSPLSAPGDGSSLSPSGNGSGLSSGMDGSGLVGPAARESAPLPRPMPDGPAAGLHRAGTSSTAAPAAPTASTASARPVRLRPDPPAGPGAVVPVPEPVPAVRLAAGVPRRASPQAGYRPVPLPVGALGAILSAAGGGYPADLPGAGDGLAATALCLLALRVDGLPRGGYWYDPERRVLREVAPAERIAAVATGRLLANTKIALRGAAAVLVPVGDPLAGVGLFGDRWYRLQQIEAGLVVQRAALAAAALGLAARIHSDGANDTTDEVLGIAGTQLRSLSFLAMGTPLTGGPLLARHIPHDPREEVRPNP
ncbi:SagB family peptide dehydrogenase [Sphaerisporangium dianthi]|uniref:SagB family peptide dehydrogenase n=1 Tax=Sphaerisporangium dianthi TaxID=1436120 RepID=A0ABV9CLP0_9ACTN